MSSFLLAVLDHLLALFQQARHPLTRLRLCVSPSSVNASFIRSTCVLVSSRWFVNASLQRLGLCRLDHRRQRLDELSLGVQQVLELLEQQILDHVRVGRDVVLRSSIELHLRRRRALRSAKAGDSTSSSPSPSFHGPRASISPSSPSPVESLKN